MIVEFVTIKIIQQLSANWNLSYFNRPNIGRHTYSVVGYGRAYFRSFIETKEISGHLEIVLRC